MNIKDIRKTSFPVCQASKRFNKVFGIGANKTGTTSLMMVFALLGLKVAPQQEGELMGMQGYHGHLDGLRSYIDRYDAFQDAPFSVKTVYAQLDALFPGSRFILTHRDPEVWFTSFRDYYRRQYPVVDGVATVDAAQLQAYRYLYPGYHRHYMESNWLLDVDSQLQLRVNHDLLFDRQHHIDLYVQRNRAIVQHFSDRPGDLLVIDITREPDTRRIVDFLGLPESLVTPMPRVNTAEQHRVVPSA